MVENRSTEPYCYIQGSHAPLKSIAVDPLGSGETHFRLYFFIDGRNLPVENIPAQAREAARRAVEGHPPYTGPISVAMRFHISSPGQFDLDRFSEAVLQGMRGVVYEEDWQVQNVIIRNIVMKDAPGVMVIVEEL